MRKGTTNERSIEIAIAHLHGRIENQIEQFSAGFGIQANWVAARISDLLSPEGTRIQHHMSTVRIETTGMDRELEPLALAIDAHSSETPTATQAGRKTGGSRAYWTKMTPEQRSAEMKKRLNKWSPQAKEKWSKKAKMKTKQQKERQVLYQARSDARKRGLPLPPLKLLPAVQ